MLFLFSLMKSFGCYFADVLFNYCSVYIHFISLLALQQVVHYCAANAYRCPQYTGEFAIYPHNKLIFGAGYILIEGAIFVFIS